MQHKAKQKNVKTNIILERITYRYIKRIENIAKSTKMVGASSIGLFIIFSELSNEVSVLHFRLEPSQKYVTSLINNSRQFTLI